MIRTSTKIRYILFLAALLCAGRPARAQCNYTTVTGTVTDANGVPYAFAQVSADLVPAPPGQPICGGQPFSGHIGPVTSNSSGAFQILVPPSASITPATTHWQFTVGISPGVAPPFGTGPQSFSVSGITISGSTQSLTSTLSTAAPALTVPFGGGTNILPLNNTFTGTNGFQAITATSITDTGLTSGAVTNICASTAGALQITGCPSATFNGGTVANPTTFSSSIFNCGPNPWIDITCYGARAVSTIPTGTATFNGTTTITLSGLTAQFANPDGITVLGAGATNVMATPAAPGVTAVLAQVGMNTGDTAPGLTGGTPYAYCIVGIDLGRGTTACSPTTSIATGPATLGPVITNVTSIAQSNNIFTVTTASASGTNTNAQIYLTGSTNPTFSGPRKTATVTDSTHFTFAGGDDTRNETNPPAPATGGTVTVYNANEIAIPSSIVSISGTSVSLTSGANFNTGWPAGTLLVVNGICTTVGSVGSTSAMTIATTTACPTLPTGTAAVLQTANQFAVYNATSGAFVGLCRPGETVCDDFGQAAPARPIWLPATMPGSATNDELTTTVASGGGTNTLVLNAAATQTGTGTAVMDAGPGFKAAYVAASTSPLSSSIHIPVAATGTVYPFQSYTAVSGGVSPTVLMQNPILVNDTIALTGGMTWTGELGGASPACAGSFSWAAAQQIEVGTAFPALALPSGSLILDKVALVAQHDNGLMATIGPGGGFNVTISNSCFMRVGGTDTLGMAIVGYGASEQTYDHVLFSINDTSANGSIITPLVFYRNDNQNLNGSGDFVCHSCFNVGRGFLFDSFPMSGSNSHYDFYDGYAQQMRSPLVTFGGLNAPTINITGQTQDTISIAAVALIGTNDPAVNIIALPDLGVEANGVPGLVSGTPITGLNANTQATTLGQNTSTARFRSQVFLAGLSTTPDFESLQYFDSEVRIGPGYTMFSPLAGPATVTATVCASGPSCGGSIPVGNWTYETVANDVNGRPSTPVKTASPCAVTTGNQTCTDNYSAVTYARSYSTYRSNGGGFGGVVGCINITALFCTDSAPGQGGGPAVQVGTAGETIFSQSQISTPQLTLVGPLGGANISPTCAIAYTGNTCPFGSIFQTAANQFASAGVMTGGTFTFSFPVGYTSAPICTATDTSAIAAVRIVPTNSGVTITGTAGDTAAFVCVGNPN